MSETGPDRPSTTSLIGDALKQTSALFSAEINLARVEATEKLVTAVAAVVSVVVAGVFMIVALIFLLEGLVEFLVHLGWEPFAASFAVGGGIAVIALIAILVAVRRLSSGTLSPERTVRQVKGVISGSRP